MRVFKYKRFQQWAKTENLADHIIIQAVREIENGLYDVNLGGGLYKKRIARKGKGKSSGYRTLIIFKQWERAIFVYGFAKNEKNNISPQEKEIYKLLAKYYLDLTANELLSLIENGELLEVKCDEDAKQSEKSRHADCCEGDGARII